MDLRSMRAFRDELEKIASPAPVPPSPVMRNLGLGGLALGSLLVGAKGTNILHDAREGKVSRLQREQAQREFIKSMGPFASKEQDQGGY